MRERHELALGSMNARFLHNRLFCLNRSKEFGLMVQFAATSLLQLQFFSLQSLSYLVLLTVDYYRLPTGKQKPGTSTTLSKHTDRECDVVVS